jgi:aspartyl-tRNA(Asn)/glutamyl-tRNA(Gln) amidotransferase subunit A
MTPWADACEIRAAIAGGRLSARDACDAALGRIARLDPKIHAFLHVDQAAGRARTGEADRDPDADRPLLGVPVAVKDNLCTNGMPATAGSRLLDGYHPPYTATAVARLQRAGAIVIGKTNCDEFAMGSSTEHSAYGATRNPWDVERTPGGSSGGSAAAVAAGLVPIALGSDTGGSVRQPAALCGVVGLKPTYGRVSRYGLIAFASSLDQIGPLTRSVRDAAAVLQAMAGPDPQDATTVDVPVSDYVGALTGTIDGLRIGVPRHVLSEGVDVDVARAFDGAVDELRQAGATIVDIELPHVSLGIAVYYLVANAEASSNLARYDGVRYGPRANAASLAETYVRTRALFGAEAKRRIMIGTYVLSAGYYDAYYVKAQQVRTLIRRAYDAALAAVDVIALPTSPTPAFRLGERTGDPLKMYLSDVFTVAVNLAGLPAISLPCGFSTGGLPVGLQLVGRAFDEATILRVGEAYERRTPWVHMHPTAFG